MAHACSVEEAGLLSPVRIDSRQLSVDQLLEVTFMYNTPFFNHSPLLSYVGDLGKGFHPTFVGVPAVVREKSRHLKVLREAVEKRTFEPSWLWLSIRIPTAGVASLPLPCQRSWSFAE